MSISPYALILKLRHKLYDKGIFKSETTATPTICLGNITVGGTGKTPHTEMILRMLEGSFRTAVLSRGYKRKSKGFAFVSTEGGAAYYGDEPVQIKRNFPETTVAVDKNRNRGIAKMEEMPAGTRPEVIILDDAFQYRKLRASLNILLMDWSRPVCKDKLLPAGRLRDIPERTEAADIVIVTKCPPYTERAEMEQWLQQNPLPDKFRIGENIFFTEIHHAYAKPVFPEGDTRYTYSPRVILVTGIANNKPLLAHLSESYMLMKKIEFPDHHAFTRRDIRSISAAAKEHPTAMVLTTEKDAQRILDCPFIPEDLKKKLFFTPITVDFTTPIQKEVFSKLISACAKGNHDIV